MENVDINRFAKRNYYTPKDSGNSFFWGVIAPYIAVIIAIMIGTFVVGSSGGDVNSIADSLWLTIITSVLTPVSFIVLFFIYNKKKKISLKASKLNFKLDYKKVILVICLSFVFVFGLLYLIQAIDLGLVKLGYKLSDTGLPINTPGWYVLNLILLALLPAIGEELLFRGIIFNGLRGNIKEIWAIVISGALFALMHGSLEQLVYPFIMGCVFAWIVARTGSIVYSMIMHFFNNAIVLTLTYINEVTGFDFMPQKEWVFWMLMPILFLVTCLVVFIVEKFVFKTAKDQERNIEVVDNKEKVMNTSMILGIIAAGILFVVGVVSAFL